MHFIIWEQKDLSLPIHSFAQDPPFCTLLFSVPVPVMAMALSLVPSTPLPVYVFKSYLSFTSSLKHLPLAAFPNLSTRDHAFFLVSYGQAIREDFSEPLSWLVSISTQCVSILMSLFFSTRFLNGRIWSKSDSSLYFLQLPAQRFTQETSPVGVCGMNIICLYHVFSPLVLTSVSFSSPGFSPSSF